MHQNPIYSVFKREHALKSSMLGQRWLLQSGSVVSENYTHYEY